MKNNKFQFYDLKINMKVEHMKKNPYALFFCPLSKKVIKKLLTFCYWKNGEVDFDQLWCQTCSV